MKRLKYTKWAVTDGDTIKVILKGRPKSLMLRSIRIVGVNTEELKDPDPKMRKRAIEAKEVLETLMSKWIKPRLFAKSVKTREGWHTYRLCPRGRLLCKLFYWRWDKLGWHNYSDLIKEKNLHVKGCKWNEEVNW